MQKRDEKTLESALGRAGDPQKLDTQATGTDNIREPKPGRRKRELRPEDDESASQASRQTERRRDDL